MDQQLAPIIEQLEETHQIGKCDLHPDLRCYVQKVNSNHWHFDLDLNRLQVWASAIVSYYVCYDVIQLADTQLKLCKHTNLDKAPIGSNFFHPKDRLGYKNEAPQTPIPSFPHPGPHSPWSQPPYQNFGMPSPHAPHTFFPYGGMAVPGYPPMPWGYPQPHTPGSMPSSAHALPTPSMLMQASSSVNQLTVEEWCNQHNLGDDECQGLTKLGFHVGDKLDALAKDVWEWAGLGPLHQQRILAVYSVEQCA